LGVGEKTERDPLSAVGGLEGIDKRVGSRGKKNESEKVSNRKRKKPIQRSG
jgi:hypothetical protein